MKTGIAILLIGAMEVRSEAAAIDLETRLTQAIVNKNYQSPTASELAQARELFLRMLQSEHAATNVRRRTGDGETANDLAHAWARLGFEFHEVKTEKESLWLLCEPEGKETGRGWYLFRPNSETAVALQTPHSKNDIHTGLIGLRVFLAGKARVYAASSITRRRADMAHLEDTFFQALTVAFAQACPTGLVVQLHGFESANHHEARTDMVASAGTRSPGPWFGELVRNIKHATSLKVLRYPEDTTELGGTLNRQGRALRQGTCRFLHLEMSMELRQRLASDKNLAAALARCF